MPHTDPAPLDRERDQLSEDKERNKILEDVLRDQARREVLRDVAYRRPTASLRARVIALLLVLVALALWMFPAPGLRPQVAFPLAPPDEEVAMRIAAYVQAQQVEAFRESNGRLPDLLRETGEPLSGIDYVRLDARTYRITNMTERDTVRWLSTDSFPTLLGDSGVARLRAVVR